MYLHLGNDVVVRKSDVVGIFDLDNTSQSALTRRYLAAAEKDGRVVNAAGLELPKSFVVCTDGERQTVYLSQLNSSTLLKRSEAERIREDFRAIGLPVEAPVLVEDLQAAILQDKKRTGGTIRYVLPEKIGKATLWEESVTA